MALTLLFLLLSFISVHPKPLSDTDYLTMFRLDVDIHGVLAANWTTSNACTAHWQGITCSHNNTRVISLLLPSSNLRGPLHSLAGLDQLRLLDLHDNRLNSTLDPLASLVNLKLLYLSGNDLSGEISGVFRGLTRLLRVDLSDNNLRGLIPWSALCSVGHLLTVRLQDNLFSGGVEDVSKALPWLIELNVSNNQLSGRVPDAMRKKFGMRSFVGNAGLCGSAFPLPHCVVAGSLPSSPLSLPRSPNVVLSNPSSMPRTLGSSPGSALVEAAARPSGRLSARAVAGIAIANALFIVALLSALVACCCCTRGNLVSKDDKRKVGNGEDGYCYSSDGEAHVYKNEKLRDGRYSEGCTDGEASDEGHANNNKLVFFEEEEDGLGEGSSKEKQSKRFELEELLKASAEMVGKGSLGTVYRAALGDGSMVAVKRLRDANPCPRKDFHRYMDLIGRLRHPNLVNLKAYYYAKQEKLLIYDYLSNATLYLLLHGNRGPGRIPLDWSTRLRFVLGAARGLARIHEEYRTSMIPHGNVKSSNILINGKGEACLSDFGLSLLLDPAQATARLGGYRAPEQAETKHLSQEADVYSFGVVVLEVLTGRAPSHQPHLPEWVRSVVREEWTAEVFDAELLRYKNIEEDLVAMLHVGLACVANKPEQRPAMVEVVQMIQGIRVRDEDNQSSPLSVSSLSN